MTEQWRPTFHVSPASVLEGAHLVLRGSGWPDCPIVIERDGKAVVPQTLPLGSRAGDGLRPDSRGDFAASVWTRGWEAGRHTLAARSEHAGTTPHTAEIVVARRHLVEGFEANEKDREHTAEQIGGEPGDTAYRRAAFLFDRAFDRLGYIPSGLPLQQIAEVRHRRNERAGQKPDGPVVRSIIVAGACNWTPVASAPALAGPFVGNSGRVNVIVVDPLAADTLYLGSAGGGVWKTTDRGANWAPISDYQGSLRIGSLAIDPHHHLRIYAGTGDGGYPGIGLLRSEDGGVTWIEEAAGTLGGSNVKRIVFDASDPTSHHMFAATTHGIYETVDGVTWTQLRAGMADDVVLVPGTGGAMTLVAAFTTEGLFRATKSGGSWSAWTQSVDADLPTSYGRIALGQCAGTPDTILAIVAQSSYDGIAGVFRTTAGGSSWTRVDVRLDTHYNASDITGLGHYHTLTIPLADLTAAPAPHTYTTGSAGSPAHTHTITLTAAQMQAIAGGAQTEGTTTADSTGHTHTFVVYAVSQANYNLYAAVHPTAPNTIYLGATFIWKNTAGGGVFANISDTLHVDQHAFAFDPVDPTNRVWAGNDGGIFESVSGGASWTSRNNGLATLEYYSVAVHPLWENVLIAGAQDNGVQRYSGSPVALEVYGWDIMLTAIDPAEPRFMYIARQNQNGVMRSDSAGEPGSWSDTAPVPAGSPQFGNPFVLDPSDAHVCFFGNTRLWRSPMRGDSWVDVTGELSSSVRAIAVHPTDPTTVYFSTLSQVYRAHRTGATWSGSDVTVTGLGSPMASGVSLQVSSLAVESGGAVWATSSSTIGGGCPHAFRLESGAWVARSTGLPPSVGINTMVIDRTTPETRFFLGGGLGVYRSDDGGNLWAAWDAGIPNVPVSTLVIGPGRMIRASTGGRSVWEREIDPPLPCPAVDLYMRDTIVDSGRRHPSPEGVAHPFDPARLVWHWQSPDIKVDAEEGSPAAFQTTAIITDPVAFASIRHRNPRRTRINRFYAQIHNRGSFPAHNVLARAFFVDAHAGLALPADFWTMGHPFSGTPSGTGWTDVGPARSFTQVDPNRPVVAAWEWFVPVTAGEHSCLLVVVTSDENVLDGVAFTNVDSLVLARKLAAQKNLHVVNMPGDDPTEPADASLIELGTTTHDARSANAAEPLTSISVHWGNLPKDARIVFAFERLDPRPYPVLASRETLQRAGVAIAASEKGWFPEVRSSRCGRDRHFWLDRVLVLSHSHPTTTIPDVTVATGGLGLQFRLLLAGRRPKDDLFFDIVRHDGSRIVGGNSYVVHTPQNEQVSYFSLVTHQS